MSLESPDNEKNFPGLYKQGSLAEPATEEDGGRGGAGRKRDSSRKRDGKKEKKEKGYSMFEEEESEEEVILPDDIKSPTKAKKNKAGFKFPVKKDIFPRLKEKDEKKDKESKKEEKEKKKEEKEGKKVKVKDKEKKKSKHGRMDLKPAPPPASECENPIFGVSLATAVERNRSHDGIQLPAIVRECIDYVEECGLTCEGIYRISGVKSKVQQLKDCYNKGAPVDLGEHEPSIVASLLKQFLRELPQPVLTTQLMVKFEEASTIKNEKKKVEQLVRLVEELPPCNRLLLSWMIVHMTHIIELQKENKMSLQNVSIVLSPTMQISHRVLNALFTLAHQIFKDTYLKKYVPPLKPATSRWSLELPDSTGALEEELAKQESLLAQLHARLNLGHPDPHSEDQLWEVQRVVTQLKRKIKFAKKTQGTASERRRKDLEVKRSSQLSDTEELYLDLRQAPAPPPPSTTSTTAAVESPPEEHTEEVAKDKSSVEDSRKTTASKEKVPKKIKVYEPAPVKEKNNGDQAPAKEDSSEKENVEEASKSEDVPTLKEADQADEEDEEKEEDTKTGENSPETEATEDAPAKEKKADKEKKRSEVKPDSQDASASQSETQETQPVSAVELPADQTSRPAPDVEKPPEEGDRQTTAKLEKTVSICAPAGVAQATIPEETLGKEEKTAVKVEEEGVGGREKEHRKTVTLKDPLKGAGEEGEKVAKEKVSVPAQTRDKVAELPMRAVPAIVEEKPRGPVQVHPHLYLLLEPLQPIKAQPLKPRRERADKTEESQRRSAKLRELEEELLGGGSPDPQTKVVEEEEAEEEEDDYDYDPADDEELQQLVEEEFCMRLEEEELLAIGDELRQKIETEESEIERLQQEIQELQYLRHDSDLEEMSSGSDSSYESEDEDDMNDMLSTLIQENLQLERENAEMCQKIHEERMICLSVKLQIRLLQQKQLESSQSSLLGDA